MEMGRKKSENWSLISPLPPPPFLYNLEFESIPNTMKELLLYKKVHDEITFSEKGFLLKATESYCQKHYGILPSQQHIKKVTCT